MSVDDVDQHRVQPLRRRRVVPDVRVGPDESEIVMTPSIGRIVHYVSYGTPGGEYNRECRAAIITEVARANEVGLFVANPTGLFLNRGVRLDEGDHDPAGGTNLCDGLDYGGGTWHWPARVTT